MQISAKTWNNYITRLSKLNQTAGQLMQKYIDQHGTQNTSELIGYAYGLVTKYGEGSAELACQMYEAIAAAESVTVPAAEPAATASYGEVARMVNATKQSPPQMQQGVSRLVKRASSDTTLKNAQRDGAQFAWVPHGDTCPFCITLASRGWQRISKAALKNGHAEHIHANCDCEYAVRFDSSTSVAGYDPSVYLKLYKNAGGNPNVIRREQYARKKKKINAQKRAAYAAKNLDFMGAPKDFADRNGLVSVKAYQVKGHDTIFTQTNTADAQKTIKLISEKSGESKQLNRVQEIIVTKDIPGIAAYDHVDNRLYVNEKISNARFIKERLSGGYFVAENAEDILRHEMHHKEHWDFIKAKTLTSGKNSDIVKQEIEAELREYVQKQHVSDPFYVRDTVSKNAERCFKVQHSLNELIADALLCEDKKMDIDSTLVELARRCTQ